LKKNQEEKEKDGMGNKKTHDKYLPDSW